MQTLSCPKCRNCSCHQNPLIFHNPTIYYDALASHSTNSFQKSVHFHNINMGPKSNYNAPVNPRKSVHSGSCRETGTTTTNQKRKSEPFRRYCGEAPRIFTAPPIIKSKTKSITTAIRDYGPSSVRNFVAVPQAVTLYDENPLGDIRMSREEFEKLVAVAYKDGAEYRNGRKCNELNQPKFNSLRKSVKEIQSAIGNLERIPLQIERTVRTDPGLQKRIQETVTKKLNIPQKARLYQELIPVEAREEEKRTSAEEILKGMKSLHPPPKPKDPEPNILNFNKPTFSRIKPRLPDPPPKPTQGVSTTLNEDFQLILNEAEFSEKDSNASLFQLPFVDK